MLRPTLLLSICVLCASLLLFGCGKKEPVPEGMYVTVNFGDVHRCSRISPEIVVHNPPKDAAYFDVRVSVAGAKRHLGGGRWGGGELNEDGDLVIPEGGLTNAYRGPCPPRESASDRSFSFLVLAMSRSSATPLAVAEYIMTLED